MGCDVPGGTCEGISGAERAKQTNKQTRVFMVLVTARMLRAAWARILRISRLQKRNCHSQIPPIALHASHESAAFILGINNWIISPAESSEDSGAV